MDFLYGPPFYLSFPVVFLQGLTFLVFYALLRRHLFDKVLVFLHHRGKEIEERTADVEERRKALAERAAAYQAGIAAADKKGYEAMQAVVREGLAKKTEAVSTSYDESNRLLLQSREVLAAERHEALQAVRKSVDDLATVMIKAVTSPGQKVSAQSMISAPTWSGPRPAPTVEAKDAPAKSKDKDKGKPAEPRHEAPPKPAERPKEPEKPKAMEPKPVPPPAPAAPPKPAEKPKEPEKAKVVEPKPPPPAPPPAPAAAPPAKPAQAEKDEDEGDDDDKKSKKKRRKKKK